MKMPTKKQTPRKNSTLSTILFLSAMVSFLSCKDLSTAKPAGSQPAKPIIAEKKLEAKNFQLKDRRGKTHALTEWKGKVVLLHFWATWCAPCIDEIPVIVDAVKKMKSESGKKDVELIAVSLDEKWEEADKIFPVKEEGGRITTLLDPESKVSNEYGSYQFPETYLISADQKIITKWIGPQKWEDPGFLKALEPYR